MKMPEKRKGFDMSGLADAANGKADSADMDAGNSDENAEADEESSESPDERKQEAAELSNVSDDELMAEIKKRGLMDQLSKGGSGDSSASGDSSNQDDQSMYS